VSSVAVRRHAARVCIIN